MALAGIEIRYLVNQISNLTKDYYVSNIYSVTKDSLLFKFHHPEKQDVMLMLSTFGFWQSSVKIEPIEQNRLLKRLRSDLLRLKLTKIEQIGAERIVYLTFAGFDKEFIIIGEFFSDGNVILCNNEMKILALLHSIDVRHRTLKVGMQYVAPPQNGLNIFKININDLLELRSADISCAKWVGRSLGLPTKYVDEIFRRSNIDTNLKGVELQEEQIKTLFDTITTLVRDVTEGNHDPIIINNEKMDVLPIKIETNSSNVTAVPTFMEGLDKTFTENILEKGKTIQSTGIDKEITELEHKLEEQDKAISVVKEKSSEIAKVAKYLQQMNSSGIISLDDHRAKNMLSKVNVIIIKEKGISKLKIQDAKIEFNIKSSLPAIASSLFNESKRQSNAIESIEQLKKQTEKRIAKLAKKAENAANNVSYSEVKKKNWFERYRWFYTSDGLLAIGGRDSSSNSSIIRKHLEKNDLVFHADIFGSPFFILKNGKGAPSASLNEIAHATVCFSRAWREAMYGLSAYWVNPEQVKKAAPSGQFLPKGSFTIDGQRNFVRVSTMRLAVGLIQHDDDIILSCGPPEPIKKNSIGYVVIEPSGSELVDTAKKIKIEFLKMREEITKTINLDDFVRVLPAGKSNIVESKINLDE